MAYIRSKVIPEFNRSWKKNEYLWELILDDGIVYLEYSTLMVGQAR